MDKSIVNGDIYEFVQWYDSEGRIINASDGGIIYAEGSYHWYGQALRPKKAAFHGEGGQTTTVGVVMYRSENLYEWEYEGVILSCGKESETDSELRSPMRFERPKIVYNKKTQKYVLWCHYVCYPGDHGSRLGTGEAGVAQSDKVNGPYQWLGYTRPIDENGAVKDCTLFRDQNENAYFIYDRMETEENRCQHIVRLSDDYLCMTSEYARLNEIYRREAASVVWYDGYYFMITSGLTSWNPNQACYYRAKDLFGPWEEMGDPCIGDRDHSSFRSQSTYIFRVENTELFIYMAERHNTENFELCSYIWLPVRFTKDHRLYLSYEKSWSIEEALEENRNSFHI